MWTNKFNKKHTTYPTIHNTVCRAFTLQTISCFLGHMILKGAWWSFIAKLKMYKSWVLGEGIMFGSEAGRWQDHTSSISWLSTSVPIQNIDTDSLIGCITPNIFGPIYYIYHLNLCSTDPNYFVVKSQVF